ncbi:MAG: hypothetical protein DMG68_20270, partial [Acidobacteria bacterium]
MEQQVTAGFWLSPQQQRVWSLQAGTEGSKYRALCALSKLKAAVELAVSRHEILRTVFHHQPGVKMPFQVIRETGSVRWEEHDFSQCDNETQAGQQERIWAEAESRAFDLVNGPLLHASLAKTSADRHVLTFSVPALNGDAATLQNLAAEILRCYAASRGEGELPDEVLQYADVAQWQQDLLESEEAKAGREFWRDELRKLGLSPLHSLSLPSENASTEEFLPKIFSITSSLTDEIDALSQKHGFSASDFLLACWQLLLARFTGASDLLIAFAADGRRYEELRDALGTLTRHLPLRLIVGNGSSFLQLLSATAGAARNATKWQESFLPEQVETIASPFAYPFAFEYS